MLVSAIIYRWIDLFGGILEKESSCGRFLPHDVIESASTDKIAETLHEEIQKFEEDVNAFHKEKRPLFESLLAAIKEAIAEFIPGSLVKLFIFNYLLTHATSAIFTDHIERTSGFLGQISIS